jgi:hypothetical protein
VRGFVAVVPQGATAASDESLSLAGGATYYVTVRAFNGAGMAVAATSDGVTVAADVAVPLVEGYNLVALPVRPVTPHTAQSLAEEMNRGGLGVTRVLRYNGTGYDVHVVGSGGGFEVRVGEGYFVRASAGGIWSARGLPLGAAGAVIPLQEGYNLVGLPRVPSSPYAAQAVLDEIRGSGGDATRVLRYNGTGYDVHTDGSGAGFPLGVGEGFFIRCAAASTWTVAR